MTSLPGKALRTLFDIEIQRILGERLMILSLPGKASFWELNRCNALKKNQYILKRKRNATVFNPHESHEANFLIISCVPAH